MGEMGSSVRKVQQALEERGVACRVVELPKSTRSAKEAAQAIGCSVNQIAKSLIFRGQQTGKPFLVIASGSNRVNEEKLSAVVSEPIEMPNADFVRKTTGFAIGGVPPVGHREKIETFIDEDLLQYGEIWAAAGNPHAVFGLTPQELQKITKGELISVK